MREGIPLYFHGADGGGRTHTSSRILDFESSASANSATSATLFTMTYNYFSLWAWQLRQCLRQCSRMKRIATPGNRAGSSSSSRRYRYSKVLDNRKHAIRGLWQRNGK